MVRGSSNRFDREVKGDAWSSISGGIDRDSDSSESDMQDSQLDESDAWTEGESVGLIIRVRRAIGGIVARKMLVAACSIGDRGLFRCRSFGGVKKRGVDPGEPSWTVYGMDVVDSEEVGEGGSVAATGSTGNMEGPSIS